jgi:hypothetical protein
MEKSITINVSSTYKFLQVWNGIFNLTSMELKVLAALIDCSASIGAANLCSPAAKKAAAKMLDIKDYNTLNNYVKKFKDKKAIRKDGRNYLLSKLLDLGTKSVKININWTDER